MELRQWLADLTRELGVPEVLGSADKLDNNAVHILLDLARDSAHGVERVAAPLTTFLVGVAVGQGSSLGRAAAVATRLALGAGGSTQPEATDFED